MQLFIGVINNKWCPLAKFLLSLDIPIFPWNYISSRALFQLRVCRDIKFLSLTSARGRSYKMRVSRIFYQKNWNVYIFLIEVLVYPHKRLWNEHASLMQLPPTYYLVTSSPTFSLLFIYFFLTSLKILLSE